MSEIQKYIDKIKKYKENDDKKAEDENIENDER